MKLTIDNRVVEVPAGTTILEAADKLDIHIPRLCYLKDVNVIGSCRVCVVEVEGARNLPASCVTPVSEGMLIKTNTQRVRNARKTVIELILSNHPADCLKCVRNNRCELQTLSADLGIREIRYEGENLSYSKDDSTTSLVRDPEKCILCRRCVSVCANVQQVSAINVLERGFDTIVGPVWNKNLKDVPCVLCGQCILVCPTGALTEKDSTGVVWRALADENKHVIVQTAPAVRVVLGEEFGLEDGAIVTGQLVAALKALGFDKVFDTDFSADLTIMEEGSEFLHRLKTGGVLPLITSCSPSWIKFAEHNYPDMLDNLSTCKSPQQMFGALAKTYYAYKEGIDPKDIFMVSVMPCVAKKFECERPEMNSSGYKDVDAVITTRELANMIKEVGLDLKALREEEFDAPLGISTGAGAIFGTTGGVMEAALRTVYEIVTGEDLEDINFRNVRGLEGVKEATVKVGGMDVKVAVANGLANARNLMDKIKNKEAYYHFVEIMACPGGCIGGGGQPIGTNYEKRTARMHKIYEVDEQMVLRKSHKNPAVKLLYEEFLGEPLGEKSHHLLHTHYTVRS